MKIHYLHAFKDNLIWIMQQNGSPLVQVVDPGVASVVLDYLVKHKLVLENILLTHHHADHSGGIAELLTTFPSAKVIAHPQSPYVTMPVADLGLFTLFEGQVQGQALYIPGHTLDHTAFLIENNLFSGDTLFGAGCGRLFEGSYAQLFASLNRLKQLPKETLVYCGHEYTLSNLDFATVVEPDSIAIQNRIVATELLLAETGCSLPSSLELECETNPFLRCQDLAKFKALREWKNSF